MYNKNISTIRLHVVVSDSQTKIDIKHNSYKDN